MDLMSISNLARGGVVEQLDCEMKKVFENIMDPNTLATKKRKMTITVTFEPNVNRDEAGMQIDTKLLLAPTNSITTQIYMGKDKSGNVVAAEVTKGVLPGQSEIDQETGEIIENKIFKVK